jgi:hypothetical protein
MYINPIQIWVFCVGEWKGSSSVIKWFPLPKYWIKILMYFLYIYIYICVCVCVCVCVCGPGSSVGIATDYGVDGPGIESRWERDFPHLSRPALGPTQPPVQWVPGLSLSQSTAGACCWPLTPFQCRGHGRVELYLYPPSGPHRACNGVTLPYIYIYIYMCVCIY